MSARPALRIDWYLVFLLGAMVVAGVVPVRGQAAVCYDRVVYAAITLLFFLYGARLAPRAVRDGLLHWRLQSLVLLSTYALFPLLGWLLTLMARSLVTPPLLTGLMFLSVLPSTVQSSIAFTSIAGGNVAAALTSASISNVLGIFLTPLLVGILVDPQGTGFNLQQLENIGLQILLPFCLGQLCRPLIGAWLQRQARLTSLVDRGSIVMVVYAAFSEGVVSGAWHGVRIADVLWVIVLSCALLAMVMGLVGLASRLLGFNRSDSIAILFCGSKKSLASGVPIAGILFTGPTAPLIILPLMVFHQIQLFVCSFLAQAYADSGRRRDGLATPPPA